MLIHIKFIYLTQMYHLQHNCVDKDFSIEGTYIYAMCNIMEYAKYIRNVNKQNLYFLYHCTIPSFTSQTLLTKSE